MQIKVYCQLQLREHRHSIRQKLVGSDKFINWLRAAVPCPSPEEIAASLQFQALKHWQSERTRI